jgi:hypothetical protein
MGTNQTTYDGPRSHPHGPRSTQSTDFTHYDGPPLFTPEQLRHFGFTSSKNVRSCVQPRQPPRRCGIVLRVPFGRCGQGVRKMMAEAGYIPIKGIAGVWERRRGFLEMGMLLW